VGPDQRSYSQDVSLDSGVGVGDIFGYFLVGYFGFGYGLGI
jgi:hypothetical protein